MGSALAILAVVSTAVTVMPAAVVAQSVPNIGVTLSQPAGPRTEGGKWSLTLRLESGGGPFLDKFFPIKLEDGTAKHGTDYPYRTEGLTLSYDTTTVTNTFNLINDNIPEPPEYFTASLDFAASNWPVDTHWDPSNILGRYVAGSITSVTVSYTHLTLPTKA